MTNSIEMDPAMTRPSFRRGARMHLHTVGADQTVPKLSITTRPRPLRLPHEAMVPACRGRSVDFSRRASAVGARQGPVVPICVAAAFIDD